MTDDRLRTVMRATVIVAVVASAVGNLLAVAARGWEGMAASITPYGLAVAFGLAVLVWFASREQPDNRLIWILGASAVGSGVYVLEEGVRLLVDPTGPIRTAVNETIPAAMPATVAWMHAGAIVASSAGATLLSGFAVLLFPDGHLPSRRWRPVAVLMGMAIAVAAGFGIFHWHPGNVVPPGDQPTFQVSSVLSTAATVVSLAGLLSRFRNSSAAERSRIKWVLWGFGVFLIVTFFGYSLASPPVILTGFVVLFASFGIGIVRHNLFDVNVVISRSVTYAALAALIGVIYVGVVVGVGSILGSGDEPNPVLAVAATALVAVAFQPARLRLQRLANRLVYGRRATPYEVLSDFSRRMAATGDTLLADAARSLVEGTAAERVAVTLDLGVETIEAAAWPEDDHGDPDKSGDKEVLRLPIVEAGLQLGSLVVHLPPGQTLPDGERLLADHLASGMGLALGNQALSERLAARVDELQRSRRRLIAVQDHTRRRLERDLHDGAQQQLVALKVKLGLCRSLIGQTGDSEMAKLIDRLSADADDAVESLRDFARGVYPPLLETEGLEAAIGAQVRRSGIPVDVDADGVGRYPREIESTVYFCVLEALGDAVDRARANHARVHLSQRNGSLTFEIHDDGKVHPDSASRPGLRRIGDRLESLSGALERRWEPANGTTVIGSLPTTTTAVRS